MAELRQLSIDGKRIKEAVEAVENATAGLEITDGELTLAEIPDVSLGTITDTDLQEWMAKGLPIKVDNAYYIPSSITSSVVRYGHVNYVKATEPATHYLIAYQYLQYTKATHSLALEGAETISTEHLTAGVGIDVTNNKINIADIPVLTPNETVPENYRDWISKHLPISVSGRYYQCLSESSSSIIYECFDQTQVGGLPLQYHRYMVTYTKSTYKLGTVNDVKWNVRTTSTEDGIIRIGDNTTQTVAMNSPSSAEGRTYPVQLDSSYRAVVNVPWVSGGSSKYQHNICISGILWFSFITADSSPYTTLSEIATQLYNLGFNDDTCTINAGGGGGTEEYVGVYADEIQGGNIALMTMVTYIDPSTGDITLSNESFSISGAVVNDIVIAL